MNRSIGDTVKYLVTMRPLLNGEAIFSDESPAFRCPFEPGIGEEVTIRIRTEEAGADARSNLPIWLQILLGFGGSGFLAGGFRMPWAILLERLRRLRG